MASVQATAAVSGPGGPVTATDGNSPSNPTQRTCSDELKSLIAQHGPDVHFMQREFNILERETQPVQGQPPDSDRQSRHKRITQFVAHLRGVTDQLKAIAERISKPPESHEADQAHYWASCLTEIRLVRSHIDTALVPIRTRLEAQLSRSTRPSGTTASVEPPSAPETAQQSSSVPLPGSTATTTTTALAVAVTPAVSNSGPFPSLPAVDASLPSSSSGSVIPTATTTTANVSPNTILRENAGQSAAAMDHDRNFVTGMLDHAGDGTFEQRPLAETLEDEMALPGSPFDASDQLCMPSPMPSSMSLYDDSLALSVELSEPADAELALPVKRELDEASLCLEPDCVSGGGVQTSFTLKPPVAGLQPRKRAREGGSSEDLGRTILAPTKPKQVVYMCSLCSETYTATCSLNPWWAISRQTCPNCHKMQIPRVDISEPANAIEYHPALIRNANSQAHDEDGEHPHEDPEAADDGGEGDPHDPDPLESHKMSTTQASRLLVLITHARTCPGHHLSRKHGEVCRSVKYLMLHIRDCCGKTHDGAECAFPWCKPCKALLVHLVRCHNPSKCPICTPWDLPPALKKLKVLNQLRDQVISTVG